MKDYSYVDFERLESSQNQVLSCWWQMATVYTIILSMRRWVDSTVSYKVIVH